MTKVRPISLTFLLPFALLLLLPFAATAQSPAMQYRVTPDKNPSTHLLHISLRFDSTAPSADVAMPAWSPGAYNIHNAWRNVQEFSASDETGAALRFEKMDKQTWRIYRQSGHSLIARYNLYLRSYNDELCYITGPSVFMYAVGRSPYPAAGSISVQLDAPSGWVVQTGMDPGKTTNSFTAESYDTFVDSSIAMARGWQQTRFDYKGVPHYIVFIGKGNYDTGKITDDTKAVVTYLADMMGGVPYSKYVFFLRARSGQGAGGLEHLNSTDISFSAYDTNSPPSNYKRFMFVVAHEYFHLWNVKRIRPSILGPFDYSREQNTRNLYVSEGMTSYWAALGLKRSGVWTLEDYYDELSREIGTLQSAPGRKITSVELASWDTWNFSDNGANTRIDYYNKGELLGNLLDLEIRHRTANQRSLTDVFLYLMKNNGLPKPGFEEKRGFRDAVELITRQVAPASADFGDFFARYVSGTDEIPWNEFFEHAGLRLEEKKEKPRPSIGISTGGTLPSAFIGGPPTVLPPGQIAITSIATGSAAESAGLDVADTLIAMDGLRVDAPTFNDRFAEKKIGASVSIVVLRRDQLRTFDVVVGQNEAVTYSVAQKSDATDQQKMIFKSWMKEN